MKNFFRENKLIIILGLAAFLVYASFYFFLRPSQFGNDMWIFNTPDETANYFFADNFVGHNDLRYFESANELSGELALVHPRSTTVVDNNIVPGSFLGFVILLGVWGKIFSVGALPFLVPFFSAVAAVLFYLLIKKIFGRETALVSFVLLLFMPAFWYYSSRALFNNVLFVDLLIIGFYFLERFSNNSKRSLNLPLAGLFFGLALSLRAAEIVWLAPILLVIILLVGRGNKGLNLLILGLSGLIGLLPSLLLQKAIYGGFLVTGYVPEAGIGSRGWWPTLQSVFFPFGFDLRNVAYSLYHYWLKMFWWQAIPAVLGGLVILNQWRIKQLDKRIRNYFIIGVVVSIYFVIYYGSWFFFNNLMAQPLIGSSQTRYFLPLYIFSLPLIAYFGVSLTAAWRWRRAIGWLLLIVFISLSAWAVIWRGPESLSAVRKTIGYYHQVNKEVISLTEPEAIIVTAYNDKVFFPKRRVVFYWQEKRFLDNIEKLSSKYPIYFYSIDSGQEVDYIEGNSDFQMTPVAQFNDTEGLYHLVIKQ